MEQAITENKSIIEQQINLSILWQHAVNEQFAVVIWRLPKENTFHFLADVSGKPLETKINFEDQISGFCISPFINAEGHQTLFLKNDYYFTFDENSNIIDKQPFNITENLFLSDVLKAKSVLKSKANLERTLVAESIEPNTQLDFENLVTHATEAIKKGVLQKVIVSRKKEVVLQEPFQVVEAFDKLAKKYPNAFISAVYLPHLSSIWLGASPELLVSIDEHGIFKTMSLAATQPAFDTSGNKISLNYARWSQKEIEEQALVSRYIIECFKKVRVREYIENGPKTVEAGNLLHLQTDFIVDTNAIDFKQFATVLLELLHPTSAVCGMPKAVALDFILENENYNRDFYCGFLGPININNASNIFVNLRTLVLLGNKVNFYAGAGITADSEPNKEWCETEMKMDTLKSVLF